MNDLDNRPDPVDFYIKRFLPGCFRAIMEILSDYSQHFAKISSGQFGRIELMEMATLAEKMELMGDRISQCTFRVPSELNAIHSSIIVLGADFTYLATKFKGAITTQDDTQLVSTFERGPSMLTRGLQLIEDIRLYNDTPGVDIGALGDIVESQSTDLAQLVDKTEELSKQDDHSHHSAEVELRELASLQVEIMEVMSPLFSSLPALGRLMADLFSDQGFLKSIFSSKQSERSKLLSAFSAFANVADKLRALANTTHSDIQGPIYIMTELLERIDNDGQQMVRENRAPMMDNIAMLISRLQTAQAGAESAIRSRMMALIQIVKGSSG